jgi:hypothetical protein
MTNEWLEASQEDRDFLAETYRRTPQFITQYHLKANPVHDQGGLDRIRAGFNAQKVSNTSAEDGRLAQNADSAGGRDFSEEDHLYFCLRSSTDIQSPG